MTSSCKERHSCFGVEVGEAARIVVGNQLFADPTILFARHVTGGKMQKSGMVGGPNEVEDVERRVGIGGKSVAQVGIKIGQA